MGLEEGSLLATPSIWKHTTTREEYVLILGAQKYNEWNLAESLNFKTLIAQTCIVTIVLESIMSSVFHSAVSAAPTSLSSTTVINKDQSHVAANTTSTVLTELWGWSPQGKMESFITEDYNRASFWQLLTLFTTIWEYYLREASRLAIRCLRRLDSSADSTALELTLWAYCSLTLVDCLTTPIATPMGDRFFSLACTSYTDRYFGTHACPIVRNNMNVICWVLRSELLIGHLERTLSPNFDSNLHLRDNQATIMWWHSLTSFTPTHRYGNACVLQSKCLAETPRFTRG